MSEIGSKIAFQKGWRASKDKFRIYNISEGPSLSTGIDPDTWDLLKFQEREHISATWKERHAKGVPVKVYMTESYENKRMYWYDLDSENDYNLHLINFDDDPHVLGLNEDGDAVVNFCNFRYKPEWLEKKGKTNN